MAALTVLSATLAALGYAHSTALVLMLMALNGAAAWAVATPNNHRLTALVPRLPTVVISYNSSGIYLGQALGSALGGLLLAHGTSASTLVPGRHRARPLRPRVAPAATASTGRTAS